MRLRRAAPDPADRLDLDPRERRGARPASNPAGAMSRTERSLGIGSGDPDGPGDVATVVDRHLEAAAPAVRGRRWASRSSADRSVNVPTAMVPSATAALSGRCWGIVFTAHTVEPGLARRGTRRCEGDRDDRVGVEEASDHAPVRPRSKVGGVAQRLERELVDDVAAVAHRSSVVVVAPGSTARLQLGSRSEAVMTTTEPARGRGRGDVSPCTKWVPDRAAAVARTGSWTRTEQLREPERVKEPARSACPGC